MTTNRQTRLDKPYYFSQTEAGYKGYPYKKEKKACLWQMYACALCSLCILQFIIYTFRALKNHAVTLHIPVLLWNMSSLYPNPKLFTDFHGYGWGWEKAYKKLSDWLDLQFVSKLMLYFTFIISRQFSEWSDWTE